MTQSMWTPMYNDVRSSESRQEIGIGRSAVAGGAIVGPRLWSRVARRRQMVSDPSRSFGGIGIKWRPAPRARDREVDLSTRNSETNGCSSNPLLIALAYGTAAGTVIGDLMSCSSSGDTGPLLVFCAATTSHVPFRFSASIVIMPVRGGRTEPSTFLSP